MMTVILQYFADVADALDEGVVSYGNSLPYLAKQLFLRNWSSRILRQITQHLHRLRPKRDVMPFAVKRPAVRIEREFFELDHTQLDSRNLRQWARQCS